MYFREHDETVQVFGVLHGRRDRRRKFDPSYLSAQQASTPAQRARSVASTDGGRRRREMPSPRMALRADGSIATVVATMKRARKVSVSIQPELLAAITRRAKRIYGGNISAVIAEMGEDVKRLEAMDRYFEKYQVAPLTDEARARVDAELAGGGASRTRRKRTRAAS